MQSFHESVRLLDTLGEFELVLLNLLIDEELELVEWNFLFQRLLVKRVYFIDQEREFVELLVVHQS